MNGSGPEPGTECPPSKQFKFGMSLFIVLNILTVLYMNLAHKKIAYYGDQYRYVISQYAHIVGLDNRWTMFSSMNRHNWRYQITANYTDGRRTEQVVLPLPLQSERTFLQRNFFDSTEAKFHLNTHSQTTPKEAWARYLCRKFPEHNGMSIDSVVFKIQIQNILDPEEARQKGRDVDPLFHSSVQHIFKCPCAQKDDGS